MRNGKGMAGNRDVQYSHRSGQRSVSLPADEDSVAQSPKGRRQPERPARQNTNHRTELWGGLNGYRGSNPVRSCSCCWPTPVRLRPSVAVPQAAPQVDWVHLLCSVPRTLAGAVQLALLLRVHLAVFAGMSTAFSGMAQD